jgi:hypothetical protein
MNLYFFSTRRWFEKPYLLGAATEWPFGLMTVWQRKCVPSKISITKKINNVSVYYMYNWRCQLQYTTTTVTITFQVGSSTPPNRCFPWNTGDFGLYLLFRQRFLQLSLRVGLTFLTWNWTAVLFFSHIYIHKGYFMTFMVFSRKVFFWFSKVLNSGHSTVQVVG